MLSYLPTPKKKKNAPTIILIMKKNKEGKGQKKKGICQAPTPDLVGPFLFDIFNHKANMGFR
jgi:hypothetical protein